MLREVAELLGRFVDEFSHAFLDLISANFLLRQLVCCGFYGSIAAWKSQLLVDSRCYYLNYGPKYEVEVYMKVAPHIRDTFFSGVQLEVATCRQLVHDVALLAKTFKFSLIFLNSPSPTHFIIIDNSADYFVLFLTVSVISAFVYTCILNGYN